MRTPLLTSRAARPVVGCAVVVVPVRGAALDAPRQPTGDPRLGGFLPERRGYPGGGWRGRGSGNGGVQLAVESCDDRADLVHALRRRRRGRGFAPSGGGDRRGVGSRAAQRSDGGDVDP